MRRGNSEEDSATVALVGDIKVGKTVLLQRITGEKVQNNYAPTIGASFKLVRLDVRGRRIELKVWDTAGDERTRGLIPMYVRNAQMVLVVYDVTSEKPFRQYAEHWFNFISGAIQNQFEIIFVCNKADQENWTTPEEEIVRVASSLGSPVFFISSMMKMHIDDVLDYLKENLYNSLYGRTSVNGRIRLQL